MVPKKTITKELLAEPRILTNGSELSSCKTSSPSLPSRCRDCLSIITCTSLQCVTMMFTMITMMFTIRVFTLGENLPVPQAKLSSQKLTRLETKMTRLQNIKEYQISKTKDQPENLTSEIKSPTWGGQITWWICWRDQCPLQREQFGLDQLQTATQFLLPASQSWRGEKFM